MRQMPPGKLWAFFPSVRRAVLALAHARDLGVSSIFLLQNYLSAYSTYDQPPRAGKGNSFLRLLAVQGFRLLAALSGPLLGYLPWVSRPIRLGTHEWGFLPIHVADAVL